MSLPTERRSEFVMGDPPLALGASAQLVRSPAAGTAQIVNGTIAPDAPGLWRIRVPGAEAEIVAFRPEALAACVVIQGSDRDLGDPRARLRQIANAVPASRIIDTIEASPLAPLASEATRLDGLGDPSAAAAYRAAHREALLTERRSVAKGPPHGQPGALLPCDP